MKGLRETALNYLARREYSSHELAQKLQAKGYDSKEVADLVADLKAEKLLSNERFVEAYVNRRKAAGFGPQRIRMELQRYQLDDELIENCLSSNRHNWQQHLKKVWQKKFFRNGAVVENNQQKQMRFLMQRGFEAFSIKELQKEVNSLQQM
jgi:regulatory protein